MEHTLPALPYAMDALAPHISKETLEYHYVDGLEVGDNMLGGSLNVPDIVCEASVKAQGLHKLWRSSGLTS